MQRLKFFQKAAREPSTPEPPSLTLSNVPCVDILWYTPSTVALEKVLLQHPECKSIVEALAQEDIKTAPTTDLARLLAKQAAEAVSKMHKEKSQDGKSEKVYDSMIVYSCPFSCHWSPGN